MYAKSSIEARDKVFCLQRGHHPNQGMVWFGVNWEHGFTDVHFCESGVKTSAVVYQAMLEKVVGPLN